VEDFTLSEAKPFEDQLTDLEREITKEVEGITVRTPRPTVFTKPVPLPTTEPVRESIETVLEQRQSVHGDFHQDARISQALKHVIREGMNWPNLSPEAREALDNIMTKVSRVLAGDHRHPGHWDDVIGYATLVLRTLS
jgi:hypothetical protein